MIVKAIVNGLSNLDPKIRKEKIWKKKRYSSAINGIKFREKKDRLFTAF